MGTGFYNPGARGRPTTGPWQSGQNTAQLASGATLQSQQLSTATQHGPGQTWPAGSYPQNWDEGKSSAQQTSWAQLQTQQDQESGEPLEVSPGVWVYPNGQLVTGEELQALNSASTVLPSSSVAVGQNTVLAEQQAEAGLVPVTSTNTPAASTSWLDETTLMAPYSNGEVVAGGAALALVIWLFKGKK